MQWEYLQITIDENGRVVREDGIVVEHAVKQYLFPDYANRCGTVGWELVTAVASEGSRVEYIFKRCKSW